MKDSNRLIAEFMDVFPRQGEERTGMKDFYSPIDLDISGLPDELTLADDLDFEQWQWLMPVVEKIEEIEGISIRMEGLSVEVLKGTMPYEDNDDVVICRGDVDIRKDKLYCVYTAVVSFIKFYNTQNKKA